MKQQYGLKLTAVVAACVGTVMMVGVGCNKKAEAAAKTDVKTAVETKSAADSKPAAAVPVKAPAPSTILAQVNDAKLTVGDVDKQIASMMGANAGKMDPAQMEAVAGRYRRQAAERFVVRSLLEQEVAKRKIKATDKDVDEAIAMIKTRLPKDMTMDDVLKKENMTLSDLRSNLMEEVRIKLLVESEVPTNAAVSDEEVSKFYTEQQANFVQPETVSAKHILVMVDEKDTDKVKAEKKAKIDGIRKQLLAGGDFDKLAKENSDCPSKEKGGDLGSFPRGQMVKEFDDAAFSQPVDKIGEVVKTQFGYHVIKVTEHAAGKTSSLAEVKGKLVEYLRQKKQMGMFEAFVAKLKSQAKVTISDLAKAQEDPMMMPMGE